MHDTHRSSNDVAFTPAIKALQTRKGWRHAYRRMQERGGWETHITPDLAKFIETQTSAFLATANAEGQPYIGTAAACLGSYTRTNSEGIMLPVLRRK